MGDKSFTGFIGIMAMVAVFLPWINLSSSSSMRSSEGVIDSVFNMSHGYNGIQDLLGIACLCLLIIGLITYLNNSILALIPCVLAFFIGLFITFGFLNVDSLNFNFNMDSEYGSISSRSSLKNGYGLYLFNFFSFLFIVFIWAYFSGEEKEGSKSLSIQKGQEYENYFEMKDKLLDRILILYSKNVIDEEVYEKIKKDIEGNF